jgi:SAM-dependent methyltransferase
MTDVDELLRGLEFSGYQRLVLPSGRVIPGRNLSALADLVFPETLEGKTVLDVGCYYGYFLHQAVERGAVRAVGLEPDARRFHVARTLAPLWNGRIEVRQTTIEELAPGETFDYVLFLRVLHHVADPIRAMQAVADHSRGVAVVMFREPQNLQFTSEAMRGTARSGLKARLKARLHSSLLGWLGRDLALIGVGATASARGYYFNRKALRNAFLIHQRLFENIAFRPTEKPGLTVALCTTLEDRIRR